MKKEKDEPPGSLSFTSLQSERTLSFQGKKRNTVIDISGSLTANGFHIDISSPIISRSLDLNYPGDVWQNYSSFEKEKLLGNIVYSFTAHLPLLFSKNLILSYNFPQPLVYTWINHLFLRFLPSYWYLYKGRRGSKVLPIMRNWINTKTIFSSFRYLNSNFEKTSEKNVIIPFTFGKDSLLTYLLAKDSGLNPYLVYFNEPTEKYAKKHKISLIRKLNEECDEEVCFIDNSFAALRAKDDGWFGWESTLTSYALLSIPFANFHKAKYIIFSNEISCNDYFYGNENLRVMFDYEQSDIATEELSSLTQSLSKGEVLCINFLQGLYEISIIGILKIRYRKYLKYLMSCWAEVPSAKETRWCHKCSKCARIFLFLAANGVDPKKETGFNENLFKLKYEEYFSIFSRKQKNVTYDSLGTNRDEQLLAFYLAYLRNYKGELIDKFKNSKLFEEAKNRFPELINKYYGLHELTLVPGKLKDNIERIFKLCLTDLINEINKL